MKGDDFNSIYERNYRRSFLFTKSYVHDDMAAEDIVAESLVKYWRLSLSQEAETSETLLLTILKNKALDYLRHKVIHESDRKSTRLNSSHKTESRMPSSA